MSFHSQFEYQGAVSMPRYTGVRVMMMPYIIAKPRTTLPAYLQQYAPLLASIVPAAFDEDVVGYLTVDEAFVKEGETHRRPGLHVDGIGEDGDLGGWGGGGGYGAKGMYVVASHTGCRAYQQKFEGFPGLDGDCAHLADQLNVNASIAMGPGEVFWCDRLCVHESLPMQEDSYRQFVRVSMPSDAPWHEGYTENPLGIKPTGPIKTRRPGISYRP